MKKLFMALAAAVCTAAGAQTIDLSGMWHFGMGDNPRYTETIKLPGSMLTNNKGNDVSVRTKWVGSLYDSSYFYNPYMEKYRVEGNVKFPFFLTPAKHYVGNAWYCKTVFVPKEWEGRRVFLHLERAHIETTVMVNGKKAGHQMSLSVPHSYELTSLIAPGKDNKIEICIYNGIENVCVGQDSHSVTDQTQGCWNGIVGRIELQARPRTLISDVQVFPNISTNTVRVMVKLDGAKKKNRLTLTTRLSENAAIATGEGRAKLKHSDRDNAPQTEPRQSRVVVSGDSAMVELSMGSGVKLWDEFEPNLYQLTAAIDGDTVRTLFGMREIAIKGRQFYMNGRKIWMRGTLGNCCFPLTGYPPTDVESWTAIFRKCKEYGLNMMRFHSYCPPEAAFAAADKVGFYLQPEGPSWPNHGVKLRRGMFIDQYLLDETKRMVREYGNHASFCMLAAGNEPAGDWVPWVGDFVDYWKQTGDRRRVYCGASVGGGWAFDPRSEYHVKGGARGLDWSRHAPQSADDYYAAITSFTQKGRKPVTFKIDEPYISHEQGQWCAFPDLKETAQYTGAYKAANFEIFGDLLRDGGMAGQAEKFLMASGKLQTLAYKYELERNLRTKDYAGFQLLGLNDYSGQGSALVGVLNVFWREKGYCDAATWTQFCAPVVPLAKFPKFVYTNGETLSVDVEMYNAYKWPLENARTSFRITDSGGKVFAEGALHTGRIEVGKNIALGNVCAGLQGIGRPEKMTLTVATTADNAGGQRISNSWEFWVYPQTVDMPAADGIHITDTLDDKAVAVLRGGGKVLITAAGKVTLGSDVVQHYLPVFWNTSWFKMRPPHTTGAYIDIAHPLFKHFPTDSWSNLNWWELLNRAQVMNLCEMPAAYQPPIQPIDTWHVSRKLGMMVEANVLGGKLLITTMDISSDLDKRVVARQMRHAILSYMGGSDFRPQLTLDRQTVANFFVKKAKPVDMFTKDSPDELKPKLK